MKEVLLNLEIKVDEKELQVLLNKMDTDKSGKIDFHEFKSVMASNYFRRHSKQELEAAFKSFDTDGNGFLSAEEVQIVMSKKGRHMTRNEVKSMIKSLDTNKDGKISFNEFIKMFH